MSFSTELNELDAQALKDGSIVPARRGMASIQAMPAPTDQRLKVQPFQVCKYNAFTVLTHAKGSLSLT